MAADVGKHAAPLISAAAACAPAELRYLKLTMEMTVRRAAALRILRASASDVANGFSQRTAAPREMAARETGACMISVVTFEMQSRDSDFSISR